MSESSDILEFEWSIVEKLPAWHYTVSVSMSSWVSNGDELLVRCRPSGRMKMSNIKLLPWDSVKVVLNEYDLTQWRIVYRNKI